MDPKLREIYNFCREKIENNQRQLKENSELKNLSAENEAYKNIIYLIRKLVR